MKRAVFVGALLLVGCHRAPSAQKTPEAIPLTAQSITLPPETVAFPASAEILTTNCTACHSPEMVLTQPKLDAKTWAAEVGKMRSAYKATIDPADDPKIVAALLALPNQE